MIYEFFRLLAIVSAIPFQLIFFKRKTFYEEGAPRHPWRKGGALMISNHFNFWDYYMSLFIVMPRKLYVVASEMPFRSKLVTFGMKFFGVLQANRITRNMRFMDEGAALVRRGHLLQIFPEGQNTEDGEIGPFKPSYIVIAHRAKAPIIPIVTDGTYHLFKRTHIMVGKPIDLSEYIHTDKPTPSREELAATNEAIRNKMLALQAEMRALKNAKRAKKSAERNQQS